jgi:hypothetical protein
MLTIQNIENLNGQQWGEWRVSSAEASRPTKWLMTEHYCIRLYREDDGAAILIWRNINPLTKQYHVNVCYEEFSNTIYEGAFSKRVIMDKGHFLKHMMGYVNAEYEMRKQSKP